MFDTSLGLSLPGTQGVAVRRSGRSDQHPGRCRQTPGRCRPTRFNQPDPGLSSDAAKQLTSPPLAPSRFRGPREIRSYYGNSLRENKNRTSFATFLRLRIPWCPCKVEMNRKEVDLLRFWTAIRDLALRDNPQSQKSCNLGRFFVSGSQGGAGLRAGQLRRGVRCGGMAPERCGRFSLRADFGWGYHARANVGMALRCSAGMGRRATIVRYIFYWLEGNDGK